MKFEVTLDVDNAAFMDHEEGGYPDPSMEVARILRRTADRLHRFYIEQHLGGKMHMFWKTKLTLRDLNGNVVGTARYTK